MKESILKTKSFEFALKIVQLYKHLTNEKKEYVMSKQLLRSGTSVGANIRESQNAESKMDFVHKLAIAQKECDETIYWLDLLHRAEYISQIDFDTTVSNANELLKMLRSAILTTKQNLKK
jgi:four helix bundle protein